MLLFDVDGVISLFGFEHDRPPPGRYALVEGTMHFLSATAGALIAELTGTFELVWCTGWEEKADDHLPVQLGVPRGLAHVSFATPATVAPATVAPATVASATAQDAILAAARHWKLDAIDAFAGTQRPLAWIDDAHDDSCRQWAARRAGPTLLVGTEPAIGITRAHVRALRDWAASLAR